MSRAERLFDLYHYLDSKSGRTLAELAAHFGVSERTVFRDLGSLEESGVAIEFADGRYRRVGGRPQAVSLDSGELELVRLALSNPAIEKRKGPLSRALGNLISKLDSALRSRRRPAAAASLAGPERSGGAAFEVLDELERLARERRPAKLRYRSLSGGSERDRGVDPWRVFHRDGAWYLVGRCHVHDEARLFRVDRVDWVRAGRGTFQVPDDFDLDRLLESAWSVYLGDGDFEVVLRFEPRLAALIENGRHHPGERTRRRPDGSIEYRVHLSSLEEIARWVVGFGDGVAVESPPELRQQVERLAAGALGASPRGRHAAKSPRN